jgi:16S rRNA (uracil1498-N3)-methyltransferase
MSSPRFFCAVPLAPGLLIDLPEKSAIHASRALRLQTGDSAILFNGDGSDYLCELEMAAKSRVAARIVAVIRLDSESPIKVTLAQGISSGDRMDFTIQKAVEMGVTAIQPIATQRSVVKLSGERAEKRREHWQNIVISACEQSGRALVPHVAAPLALPDWLAATSKQQALRLLLSPAADQTLQTLSKPIDEIFLLIGAEGGLTPEEMDLALSQQFTAVRLGNRILRTETAALAAMAAIQTMWGDYNL